MRIPGGRPTGSIGLHRDPKRSGGRRSSNTTGSVAGGIALFVPRKGGAPFGAPVCSVLGNVRHDGVKNGLVGRPKIPLCFHAGGAEFDYVLRRIGLDAVSVDRVDF